MPRPLIVLSTLATIACGSSAQTDLPAGGTTVPMTMLYETRAVVDVMINGRGPYRFAIETGAPIVLVTRKVAAALALPEVKSMMQMHGPPGAPPMTQHTVDSLRIGTMLIRNVRVAAGQEFIAGVDGLLGLPAYHDLLMTVDYPNKQVRFERGALPAPNGRDIFPTVALGPYYGVQVDVAGKKFNAVIDTQSGSSIDIVPPMADSMPFEFPPAVAGMSAVGGRAPVERKAARLAGNVTLGDYTVQRPVIGIFPVPPGYPQTVLLGARFLRNFAVTLDESARRVRFARADHTVPPAPGVWTIGLRFAPRAVEVTPEALEPGGAAAGAGIRTGDTLVSINGRPAAEFAWPEVLGALIQEGKPMNFVLRRGGQDVPVIVLPVLVVR